VEILKEAATNASKSKAILEAKRHEIEACRTLVEEIELATLPLGDERPSAEANNRTAELIESTRVRLAEWQAAVEAIAKSHAHGSLRHAMNRVIVQGVELRSALAEARSTAGDRLNQAFCNIFLREGRAHIKSAEAAMLEADRAEGPFLTGIEVLSPEQAAKAVARCESAASSAQGVVDRACDFFKKRHAELSWYTDECSRNDAEAFTDLSKQASRLRTKLTQFIRDTEQRKSGGVN